MADRRVVFASIEDAQIVRYERSKKWWLESTGDGPSNAVPAPRRVRVEEAADLASLWLLCFDGWLYPGLLGGQRFYQHVEAYR